MQLSQQEIENSKIEIKEALGNLDGVSVEFITNKKSFFIKNIVPMTDITYFDYKKLSKYPLIFHRFCFKAKFLQNEKKKFRKKIIFEYCDYQKPFSFDNFIFCDEVEFRGCGGKANVFKNIIFEKKVDFVYSQFIHFNHIVFKDNVRFRPEENQSKKTIFHKVDFGKDVELPANSIVVTCDFQANCKIFYDKFFYNCTFNKNFAVGKYAEESKNIQLTRCQINNLKFLTPHNYTNLTFNKSNFPNELNLNKQIFSGNIKFINCIFKGKTNFKESQFKANVDFLYCVFEKELNFNEVSFVAENSKNQKIDFSTLFLKKQLIFQALNS